MKPKLMTLQLFESTLAPRPALHDSHGLAAIGGSAYGPQPVITLHHLLQSDRLPCRLTSPRSGVQPSRFLRHDRGSCAVTFSASKQCAAPPARQTLVSGGCILVGSREPPLTVDLLGPWDFNSYFLVFLFYAY